VEATDGWAVDATAAADASSVPGVPDPLGELSEDPGETPLVLIVAFFAVFALLIAAGAGVLGVALGAAGGCGGG
jgi:hypothetical protein